MSEQIGEHPITPRWFPLYLCLVAAAVLTPFAFGRAAVPWSLALNAGDVILNVLGFLPFGWAMRRTSRATTLVAVLLFSIALECGQTFLLRTPSPWDVASNTLGAVLGFSLLRAHRSSSPLRLGGRAHALASLVGASLLIAMVAWMARTLPSTDFSNWKAYPLVIGVEEQGEPTWDGTLHSLYVFDRIIDDADVTPTRVAASYESGGPILSLDFTQHAVARLDGPYGSTTIALQPDTAGGFHLARGGLVYGPGQWRLPDTISQHLFIRLTERHRMSLVADVTPGAEGRAGARRIVALSKGSQQRNFAVGQNGGDLYLRLRTTVFGPAGEDLSARIAPGGGRTTALGTIDKHWFTMRTVGVARSESYLPGRYSHWALGQGFTLTLAATVMLSALGLAWIVPTPIATRAGALGAGAALALLALYATGVFRYQMAGVVNVGIPVFVTLVACWHATAHQEHSAST